MFCINCGKEINDGAYACPYCGTVFDSAVRRPVEKFPEEPKKAEDETSAEEKTSADTGTENVDAEQTAQPWAASATRQNAGNTGAPNTDGYYQPQYKPPYEPQYIPPNNEGSERFNVLAVVAFVISFFMGFLGLIFGCVALGRHKDPTVRGKGFAIAAIIVGCANFFAFILGVITGIMG